MEVASPYFASYYDIPINGMLEVLYSSAWVGIIIFPIASYFVPRLHPKV